eukprot:2855850-Pyramimonas_sp.AAC.1
MGVECTLAVIGTGRPATCVSERAASRVVDPICSLPFCARCPPYRSEELLQSHETTGNQVQFPRHGILASEHITHGMRQEEMSARA